MSSRYGLDNVLFIDKIIQNKNGFESLGLAQFHFGCDSNTIQMQCALVLFLSVLLFDSNSSGLPATSSPSTDNDQHGDGNFPLDVQNGNNRGEIKLTDLNYDVQFLIFNRLEIEDLWNLAETNSKLKPALDAVFRSKYQEVGIKDAIGSKYFTYNFEKRLRLFDIDLSLKNIEHFGSAMRKIYVDNFSIDQFSSRSNSDKSNRIFQSINKYAGDTLECLHMGRLKENTLQQLTDPFKKVEELGLEITDEIRAGSLPLNELFPNLRRLELKMMYATGDYSVLDCEFPHLEHITFEFDDRALQRRDQIEAFLRKNSHVKGVKVAFIPREFLKELPVLLPNIENLTLNIVFVDDDVIQFDNVKHCKFYNHIMYEYGKTQNLLFPQLESLELSFSNREIERNVYDAFFEKHPHLKKLRLIWASESLALEVASKFPHLVEIILDDKVINVKNIRQGIEEHDDPAAIRE